MPSSQSVSYSKLDLNFFYDTWKRCRYRTNVWQLSSYTQKLTLLHMHTGKYRHFALASDRNRSQVIDNTSARPICVIYHRDIDFCESMCDHPRLSVVEIGNEGHVKLYYHSHYFPTTHRACGIYFVLFWLRFVQNQFPYWSFQSIMDGVATFCISGSWNDFSERDICFLICNKNDNFLCYICAQGNATNIVSFIWVTCQVIASFSRPLSLLQACQGQAS